MPDPIHLGTFQSRAAELNRKLDAARAKRDREYAALLALHAFAAIGALLLLVSIPGMTEGFRAQSLINQENVAWQK